MHVLQVLEYELGQHEQQRGQDAGHAVDGRHRRHCDEPAVHGKTLKADPVAVVLVIVQPDGQQEAGERDCDL